MTVLSEHIITHATVIVISVFIPGSIAFWFWQKRYNDKRIQKNTSIRETIKCLTFATRLHPYIQIEGMVYMPSHMTLNRPMLVYNVSSDKIRLF